MALIFYISFFLKKQNKTNLPIKLDGHHRSKSLYVATIQGREELKNGEFSYEEAIKVAKQIMFENSNRLYKLKLTLKQIDNEEYKDVSGE
ncbi:hypothetical protein C2G38_2212060 [Gigaspora rosea]|uniref:Uncharacterized protein n=1 Tax=Gigaspora rosea TaxID=44941 RepID=A0A397ULN5_9GLOM|nr:hypothetical protein C2G38_2212060 [Gigaspora rosea]